HLPVLRDARVVADPARDDHPGLLGGKALDSRIVRGGCFSLGELHAASIGGADGAWISIGWGSIRGAPADASVMGWGLTALHHRQSDFPGRTGLGSRPHRDDTSTRFSGNYGRDDRVVERNPPIYVACKF